MKSVMISIHPKWCELIASGKKTIEVRKTKPQALPPFKCYIYCAKGKSYGRTTELNDALYLGDGLELSNGKVIGEFVCDEIRRIDIPYPAYWPELDKSVLDGTCLSLTQAHDYLGHRSGYGWHISDLKIYDEPKELKYFQIPTTYPARRMTAPQSWCYAEEIE